LYTKAIKDLLKNDSKDFYKIFNDTFICNMNIRRIASNMFWSKRVGDKIYFVLTDKSGESNSSSSAILSVLIIKILNIVIDSQISISGIINGLFHEINKVHSESVINRMKPSEMLDISVCSLDIETKEFKVFTHNQNLLLKHDGKLIEIKTKEIVGAEVSEELVQVIDLKTDDVIYLFTNACKNQIGGNGQGKLTYNRFKRMLENLMTYPLNLQEEKLKQFMSDWKEKELQTEDMKFVAIKID